MEAEQNAVRQRRRETGVNDGRIVRIAGVCRHRPLWSLHMSEPAALAHSGEKTPLAHTAVEQPASPRQPALELGGPSLTSQTFEMLATASAWRHCVSL